MSASDADQSRLPGLDPETVDIVMGQMADLVLFLSPLQDIIALRAWGVVAEAVCPAWVGRSFAEVLSQESRGKLPAIFAADAATSADPLRWRHVNLSCPEAAPLPVLVKYFELGQGPRRVRLIVGRDLRPTMILQARLQRAYTEMEAAFENRASVVPDISCARVIDGMFESLGRRSLGQILTETTEALETLCISEALRRTGDDVEAAAQLLGVTSDTVRSRTRVH